MFITEFTNAHHLPLSWASSIKSISPYPTSWRSVLILSSPLHLGLPSSLFPAGFPTKILYTPLIPPIRATCFSQLILLDFITKIILGEKYRSLTSSLCSSQHSPLTSSLLGPNILINALFSNKFISPDCHLGKQLIWNRHTYPRNMTPDSRSQP
jgi:hypothetical protein